MVQKRRFTKPTQGNDTVKLIAAACGVVVLLGAVFGIYVAWQADRARQIGAENRLRLRLDREARERNPRVWAETTAAREREEDTRRIVREEMDR